MSTRVTERVRLLGRLPDHENKWRDELTQEAEVELAGDDLDEVQEAVDHKITDIRVTFTKRLHALGGAEYKEAST